MSKDLHVKGHHDYSVCGCGHTWDVPCHIQTLYGAKSKVQYFLKLAKIFMQRQNNEPSKPQNCVHTHAFKVSYFQHMPFLLSMSPLGPSGTEARCVKFWIKLPQQREIYSNRESVRDRYSEFSCENMKGPPPVIQFCCCSLQMTNRNQGLLGLFSFFSFSILSLEAPDYMQFSFPLDPQWTCTLLCVCVSVCVFVCTLNSSQMPQLNQCCAAGKDTGRTSRCSWIGPTKLSVTSSSEEERFGSTEIRNLVSFTECFLPYGSGIPQKRRR